MHPLPGRPEPSSIDPDTLRLAQQVFEWVRAGQAEPLAPLLAAGLPPNLRNTRGDSLLLLAVYHGHGPVVQLLLHAGADPDLANDRGQTALAAAAFRGDEALVAQLLAHGAAVDSPPGGRTAFITAAMFNRVGIMERLRRHGANAWAQDAAGIDALQAAQTMGAAEAVALLRRWAQERRA